MRPEAWNSRSADLSRRLERHGLRRRRHNCPYYVAPVVGDDDEIQVVSSRIAIVFRQNSLLLEMWRALRSHLLRVKKIDAHYESLLLNVALIVAFDNAVSKASLYSSHEWNGVWRDAFRDLREQNDLGTELEPFAAFHSTFDSRMVFDASRYWLDWDRNLS